MLLSPIGSKQVFAGLILSTFTICTLAWTPVPARSAGHPELAGDTLPKQNKNSNHDREPRDLDQQIQQLELGIDKLDKELTKSNLDKLDQQLAASLSNIDFSAMKRKVEQAMNEVDFKKLRLETSEAMKKVDMQQIQQQINDALAEVKDKTASKKLQQELKESMKEVQKSIAEASKVSHKELEEAFSKARAQWEKEKITIDKELFKAKESLYQHKGLIKESMVQARAGIENAKETLQSYKKMINQMEEEGLLKSNGDYTIDFQGDSLFINGKKQSQEIFDSYKSYFKKENVQIKNLNGNFNINKKN